MLFTVASLGLALSSLVNPVVASESLSQKTNKIQESIGIQEIAKDWSRFFVSQYGTYVINETFTLKSGSANAGVWATNSSCDVSVYLDQLDSYGNVRKSINLGRVSVGKGQTGYTSPNVAVDTGTYRIRVYGYIPSDGKVAIYNH